MTKPVKTVMKAKTRPLPAKAGKGKAPKAPPAEVFGPLETAWPKLDEVLAFDNLRRVTMGRPTKLTPAVHQVIITAKSSLPMSDADLARLVGITPGLLSQWKTQGEKDEKAGTTSRHRDFLNDYRASEPGFRMACLTGIRKAGEKEWRALDRLLEIHDPETFGKRLKLGLPAEVDWSRLSKDQLAEIAAGRNPFK